MMDYDYLKSEVLDWLRRGGELSCDIATELCERLGIKGRGSAFARIEALEELRRSVSEDRRKIWLMAEDVKHRIDVLTGIVRHEYPYPAAASEAKREAYRKASEKMSADLKEARRRADEAHAEQDKEHKDA